MSLSILNLRHYNTPVVEGIVHPSSNTGYKMDRLPDHKYHHRDRHGQRNFAESSARDRGRSHYNRCGHVRRSEELTPVTPGEATETQGRGSGTNIPGASFPIWSTV